MHVTVVALSAGTHSVPIVLLHGGWNTSAEALASLMSVL